jgi:hypothetical protein
MPSNSKRVERKKNPTMPAPQRRRGVEASLLTEELHLDLFQRTCRGRLGVIRRQAPVELISHFIAHWNGVRNLDQTVPDSLYETKAFGWWQLEKLSEVFHRDYSSKRKGSYPPHQQIGRPEGRPIRKQREMRLTARRRSPPATAPRPRPRGGEDPRGSAAGPARPFRGRPRDRSACRFRPG